MKKYCFLLLAVITIASPVRPQPLKAKQVPAKGLTSYVNPFIGTGAVDSSSLAGSNFPGATVPFGFVQLSPDTKSDPGYPASGYDYNDKTIVGFSHGHLSGTGIGDLFDVLLMPTIGVVQVVPGPENKPDSGYRSRFSHDQESARPGYYQVKLSDDNIDAELTATAHVGLHRYSFPSTGAAHIILDLNHSRNKGSNGASGRIIMSEIKVIDNKTIEGYRFITGWAHLRKVYFRAEFSQPFTGNEFFNENCPYNRKGCHYTNTKLVNGTRLKAVFNFNTMAGDPVMVKVAMSSVSIAGARANMKAELPGWDFEGTAAKANALWEKELGKIKVEGTTEQKTIFYTGLYHAFIQPNNIADVNGDYQATDQSIRNAPDKAHYSTFSLWDTYRAAHPLYTLVQPQKTAQFVNSMMRQYDTYGYLPIWQLWGDENYCMIGNHSIPVMVDAALKGIRGFDVNKAYEAVKGSSVTDHPNSPFSVLEKYHYMPEDTQTQSVSITLEIAFNDWCVAQLAKKLGKTEDYHHFIERSSFYKNLYDSKTGFFRAKLTTGTWQEPFDPLKYGGNGGSPYTEANAWQYLWYVPQDVQGMIGLFGGRDSFTARLDEFFTLDKANGEKNGNASGLIGQYAHGNEPSHHIIYLYDYAGQPWKTQVYVQKVMKEQYTAGPAGYSGNEDCGQMASWYIFSAMGFYPVNPASGVYAIGSPALTKADILLPGGKHFIVTAPAASAENIYVQRVMLNGKPHTTTCITQREIMQGGKLEFVMGNAPNKSWGADAASAPPSIGNF